MSTHFERNILIDIEGEEYEVLAIGRFYPGTKERIRARLEDCEPGEPSYVELDSVEGIDAESKAAIARNPKQALAAAADAANEQHILTACEENLSSARDYGDPSEDIAPLSRAASVQAAQAPSANGPRP